MLSTGSLVSAHEKHVGFKHKSSHSGVNEVENDLDIYFNRCEIEEYIKVKDEDLSCHLLPLSPTQYDACHSQFQEDKASSAEEECEEEPVAAKKQYKFKESDPEV